MALTRGATSNFPFPVCLVPKPEMWKGAVYDLRTNETMKGIYNQAMEANTADEREKILQNVGLRGVRYVEYSLDWTHTYTIH